MTLTRRKLVLVGGVVTLFAVIGAIVAVVLWQTGDSASNTSTSTSNDNSNTNNSNSTTDSTGTNGTTSDPTTYVPGNVSTATSGSASGDGSKNAITSDPSKAKYTLSAYAVGDWGTTIARESCCKRRVGYEPTNVDKNAQDVVAAVMGRAAAETDVKPKVVMGQGDSFYWVGIIDKTDQAYRFDKSFETKFNAESLSGIPWVNVMGNHDYGGSSYICAAGGTYVPCSSTGEMLQALKDKFTLQAEYKSPNSDRWIMKDHFYVHSIEDKASGVSIDIFNLDTNDADVHGAQQICCQCYGYSNGENKKCNQITPGHPHCAGGNMDMFSACMRQLKEWGEDSRNQLKEKVAASTATWKIVNTHYNPYNHYAEGRLKIWWDVLKDLGVQVWINGHTHGEKHDYAKIGMHFIENGAGGGILNEAASGIPPYAANDVEQLWAYPVHDYGFFEIKASKEWIKASFITYDGSWNVQDDFTQSSLGGVTSKYCWYIPVDGTKGQRC